MDNQQDLTSWKRILSIAWPPAIQNILFTFLLLVDLYWIGLWGGDDPITALSILGPVIWTVHSAAMFVFYGMLSMIARFVGRGDTKNATLVSYQGIIVSLVLGTLISLIGIVFADHFISLYETTEAIHSMAVDYMQIVFAANVAYYLYMALFAIFSAHNNTRSIMLLVVIAWFFNLILDPILIFGFGPIPEMGIRGAAWATFVAYFMGLAGFFIFFIKPLKQYAPFKGISDFIPKLRVIREIIKIGTPASINGVSRPLSATFIMGIISFYGPSVVAAFGISVRIISINWIYLGGLNIAVSTLVGQNLGADSVINAQKTVWKSFKLALGLQLLMSTLIAAASPHLIALFSPSDETFKVASYILVLFALVTISDVYIAVYGGALNGAGDTFRPMISSVFSNWIYKIPFTYAFYYIWPSDAIIIYWIVAISIPIEGLMNYIFYKGGAWKSREIKLEQS